MVRIHARQPIDSQLVTHQSLKSVDRSGIQFSDFGYSAAHILLVTIQPLPCDQRRSDRERDTFHDSHFLVLKRSKDSV